MSQDKHQEIIDLLQTEWDMLQSAIETLKLSDQKCQTIGIKGTRLHMNIYRKQSVTWCQR